MSLLLLQLDPAADKKYSVPILASAEGELTAEWQGPSIPIAVHGNILQGPDLRELLQCKNRRS